MLPQTAAPVALDTPQTVLGACPHDSPDTSAFLTTLENGRATQGQGNPAPEPHERPGATNGHWQTEPPRRWRRWGAPARAERQPYPSWYPSYNIRCASGRKEQRFAAQA